MTALVQMPVTQCNNAHEPVYEITYKVPEMFRKFWGLPETQTKHVCVECYNTIPAFQEDIVGPIKHLDGSEVKQIV